MMRCIAKYYENVGALLETNKQLMFETVRNETGSCYDVLQKMKFEDPKKQGPEL